MTIVIFGSEGNVARRLKAAFPDHIGIDRIAGADIVADLATVDYAEPRIAEALATAEAVLHVATSANVEAPDGVHYQAVIDAARLLNACQKHNVRRLVLPSSDWAEPKGGWATINPYGHSKRIFEAMAEMYNVTPGRKAVALRIGWVPRSHAELVGAPQWLIDNYWPDERLIAAFKAALA
jgi:nucleoside-diphosphate-sugar epimerase